MSYRGRQGPETLAGDVKKTFATSATLSQRGMRNDAPAPEHGVDASVSWGDATTLDEVLVMSPAEFQRWKTFAEARRAIGDD